MGGRFAPDTRTEPDIVLHGVDLRALETAHKNVGRLQRQTMDELASEMAVTSAAAIAARTKAMFPTARYAVFLADEQDYITPEPYAVLDADRAELTVRWKDHEGSFSGWADGEDEQDPESLYALTIDLGDHGGKLDGILSERYPAPGHGRHFDLDLDKALEIQ